MSCLKVEIYLHSDAMCVDTPYEIAQVFKRIIESLSDVRDPFEQSFMLRDSNGTQIGVCWIEDA